MSLQSVYSVLYLLVTGSLFGCNIHTNVWGFFQEGSQVSPFFSSLCHTLTMRAECLRWWMIHRDRVWTLCCELLSSDSFFSRADSEKDDMPVSKWALPLWPDRLRPALTRLSPELFWRDSHCHQNWSCAANLLTGSIKLFPLLPNVTLAPSFLNYRPNPLKQACDEDELLYQQLLLHSVQCLFTAPANVSQPS